MCKETSGKNDRMTTKKRGAEEEKQEETKNLPPSQNNGPIIYCLLQRIIPRSIQKFHSQVYSHSHIPLHSITDLSVVMKHTIIVRTGP